MPPPQERRERLAELLHALQTGGPRPPDLSAAVAGQLWDRCVQRHVEALPLGERLHVQRAWHLARTGLLAARRGALSAARQSLDESAHAGRGLPAPQAAWAFCRSVFSAAEAYLLYREGNYDHAREALRLANEADLVLLRHGVAVAHMHRAQLAHNLLRIEARCGPLGTTAHLAEHLIAHLQGTRAELPLPGPWEPELVDACPIELVAAMIHQIASEYSRPPALRPARAG